MQVKRFCDIRTPLVLVVLAAVLAGCGIRGDRELAETVLTHEGPRYERATISLSNAASQEQDLCGASFKFANTFSACPRGSQCATMHDGVVCYNATDHEPSKVLVKGFDY